MTLAAALSAAAQESDSTQSERDKIFEKAFGKKPQSPQQQKQQPQQQQIRLPVVINGQQAAHVPVLLSQSIADTKIPAAPLLDVLRPLLVPEALAAVEKEKTPDEYLSVGALHDAGLEARIDEATLSLVIEIPVKLKALQVLRVANRQPLAAGTTAAPSAAVSSYLNMRGGIDYLHAATPGTPVGTQPLNLAFESGTNVEGNVLQGDMNYVESGGRRFQRGDVSVVHDDTDNAVRYQAGDLAYPVTGFQSFEPLGGITIARNFSLQPYRVVQPAGQQDFVLTNPSRVEVIINGQPAQVLQLPAGRYSLRDFPFTQGANNVQLNVTDSVGRTTVINAPYFFNDNLLLPGESEFSYSVGLPSTEVNGLRQYSSRFPSFSAFHRLGLTDSVTSGANFQGNDLQQLAGAEISAATLVGNFSLNLAGSHDTILGSDTAASLQYNYLDINTAALSNRGVQFSAIYHGARFTTLGAGPSGSVSSGATVPLVASPSSISPITPLPSIPTPTNTPTFNPDKLDLNVGYFQALPYNFTGSVGATYGVVRGGRDTNSVDLSLRRFITSSLTGGLDVSHTDDATGRHEYRAIFTFTLSFPGNRQFLTTAYDTHQNTTQLNYQYVPPIDVGYPSANLNLSNNDQQRLLGGEVSYNTSRFESTVAHDETLPVGSNGAGLQRLSSFRFGTSLLFADGHYSVGRPVTDSFVLVVPRENLAGLTVGVNPIGEDYTAQVDFLGPAAISNVTAYQQITTQVVVPDLPIGYDLGQDLFSIQPSYHSGTIIEVGGDAVVLVDGTLIGGDGGPLALTAGLAVAEGGTGKPIEFFTNRNGRFRIEGVKPGTYALSFPGLPKASASVTIPPNTKGIYRVGKIGISTDGTRGEKDPPAEEGPKPAPAPAASSPPLPTEPSPAPTPDAPSPPVFGDPQPTPLPSAPRPPFQEPTPASPSAAPPPPIFRGTSPLPPTPAVPAPPLQKPPASAATPFPPVPAPPADVAPRPLQSDAPPMTEAAPPTSARQTAAPAVFIAVEEIAFADGSAMLPAKSRKRLGDVVKLQKRYGGAVRIVGHAPGLGDDTMAQRLARFRLALDRARAVAVALVQMGVPTKALAIEAASSGDEVWFEEARVDIALEF